MEFSLYHCNIAEVFFIFEHTGCFTKVWNKKKQYQDKETFCISNYTKDQIKRRTISNAHSLYASISNKHFSLDSAVYCKQGNGSLCFDLNSTLFLYLWMTKKKKNPWEKELSTGWEDSGFSRPLLLSIPVHTYGCDKLEVVCVVQFLDLANCRIKQANFQKDKQRFGSKQFTLKYWQT